MNLLKETILLFEIQVEHIDRFLLFYIDNSLPRFSFGKFGKWRLREIIVSRKHIFSHIFSL